MPDVSTEVAIATTTLGSAASSIDFTSISSAYTDLRLVLVGTSTANSTVAYRYNSDSGSNYSNTYLYGNGSSAVSGRFTGSTQIFTDPTTSMSTTIPNLIEIDIFSYAGSTYKTSLGAFSFDLNGSGSATRNVGLWRSTSAISSISIYPLGDTFKSGTTATLYGIL